MKKLKKVAIVSASLLVLVSIVNLCGGPGGTGAVVATIINFL